MNKLVSATFALYVALGLYSLVPFVKTLTASSGSASGLFWNHLAIFAICFVLAFVVLSRHVSSFGSPLKIFLTGLAFIGLLLTVFYHIIPLDPVYKLPALIKPYFAPDIAFSAWLVAPLVVLFF